jgi:dCMP deaminase
MTAEWDKRFMDLALHIASWSKDPSTKVGCVVVGPENGIRSVGYNGFPRGSRDDISERYERPIKYRWTEHAERNAIYNAARIGVSLANCRIYLPWYPCMDCARGIVQSGISMVVAYRPDNDHPTWGPDFRLSSELFAEAKVRVVLYEP